MIFRQVNFTLLATIMAEKIIMVPQPFRIVHGLNPVIACSLTKSSTGYIRRHHDIIMGDGSGVTLKH